MICCLRFPVSLINFDQLYKHENFSPEKKKTKTPRSFHSDNQRVYKTMVSIYQECKTSSESFECTCIYNDSIRKSQSVIRRSRRNRQCRRDWAKKTPRSVGDTLKKKKKFKCNLSKKKKKKKRCNKNAPSDLRFCIPDARVSIYPMDSSYPT